MGLYCPEGNQVQYEMERGNHKMMKLPDGFETYSEARKNGFLKMKELKDAGQRIVGTYCSFVPTELVEAAGGTVVSLCASSEEPIPAAQAHLPGTRW